MKTRFDAIIHNGTIVTANPDFETIERGIAGILGGKIALLERQDPEAPLPEAGAKIDAKGGLIAPGLVNTHTHLPMTLFRGLADDLPLDTWLNEHIFPAEAKHIDPYSVRWGALLACCEMLLSGTTACCDGYFHEEHVASAVLESGMRAVLGQGVIDFPAPGVPDPKKNVETAVEFVRKWKNKSALIRPSIFCHSPYTCSATTIKEAKKAARENGVLFQIHAAETWKERRDCEKQHGASPVRYLEKLGVLDENTLLVHAIWIDDDDIESIRRTGARVSHDPESNMKLAAGTAPLPKLLKAGITVGLGTDGCASNNTIDLFSAMDVCAKLHKVQTLDPTVADARTVFEMATVRGARSVGLGDVAGSLELGKPADIIVVDVRKPHLTPMYSPVSHLVYAVRGPDVVHVLVNGVHLVDNGRIATLDVEEILEKTSAIGIGIAK